jgi:two-component system phosphate regulon sensor histidine kinase PhoR
VNWILQTAKMKEELFNEKANMVLSRTAEALSSDTVTRQNLQIYAGKDEVHTVDSLFAHYMKYYNFHIGYYFEIHPAPVTPKNNIQWTSFNVQGTAGNGAGCYQTCLEAPGKDALELKLIIPGKEQFILAEMGVPFITSVVLILVVIVLSWRTIFSLLKEKKIAGQTTEFLNNMTHEFRTPLTNIALAGKMMMKDSAGRTDDKVKHYSGIILEENEKLRLQVEQVLSMTALERGEVPVRKTELDAHRLIQEALKCIAIQIEHRQGKVTLQLNAEHFVINGDATHLTNALCNLLDNAVKYSAENPELSIRTFNDDSAIVIVIADKGIGIDREYQKKVFDAFFRVPTGDVHDVKGFGLGLAYVKKITELHDGTIGLQSEKGKGTTFTITLPYV